ncbi:hypothetical protein ACO1O0_006507 [Amphichorda felina]
MTGSEPSTPLLAPKPSTSGTPGTPGIPGIPGSAASSRSRSGAAAITALGAGKVLLGVVGIVAPKFLGQVFLLDIAPDAYIVTRLFGSSAAAVGGSLLAADHILGKHRQQQQQRQQNQDYGAAGKELLRAFVVANIIADSVDTLSCTAALVSGAIGNGTFGMLGGGCILLAALGVVALRGV